MTGRAVRSATHPPGDGAQNCSADGLRELVRSIHATSGLARVLHGYDLRRHTTYYYAVAARDNVSGVQGPPSRVATAKTP